MMATEITRSNPFFDLPWGVFWDGQTYTSRNADEVLHYTVDVTDGAFDTDNALLSNHCGGRNVVVFCSPTIERIYGEAIRAYFAALHAPAPWTLVRLETGEANKTLANVERICRAAKQASVDRNGVLVAIGGGIVCDLVGFSASMYGRGIRYIKVNTTLVGQIDVGVGIKTAVNFAGSKNFLGSYYPAHASIVDRGLLQTLPEREVRCGLAEIVKMAVIRDARLFALLEQHHGDILRGRLARRDGSGARLDREVMDRAIRSMMEELCRNPFERNLERLVDFGHTFSPAIETESGYAIKHGEAVAIDMALSSRIAVQLGRLAEADCARILELLRAIGLPVFAPGITTPALAQRGLDNTFLRRGRKINLVIPDGIGSADFLRERAEVPDAVLEAALSDLSRAYAAPALSVLAV